MNTSDVQYRTQRIVLLPWLLLCLAGLHCGDLQAEEWPSEVKQIAYASSADKTEQPSLFYAPAGNGPKPLLVALHTWSSTYQQKDSIVYAKWCMTHGWIFIHPDFRGPNERPEATGSELAVQDVLDAGDYAKQHADVDTNRIYLVGFSGGGYLSLLMAGRAPNVWAGVSAWGPIADLQTWYFEIAQADNYYAKGIAASCGGVPQPGTAAAIECRKRSALTYLAKAANIQIDINAGIHDGLTSHALHAFNLLAARRDRIADSDIDYFVKEAKVPLPLQSAASYPPYGEKKILFRRQSRNVRVTIFDGGHEKDADAALEWLAQQRKDSTSKSIH